MSLEQELRAAGIPRGRRTRILAELDDHRHCDPHADLGDPHELARQFADELGTALARRAGFGVFLALAPVGLLFGALLLVSGSSVVNVGVVIGTQLAFVGGTLALLRAWRLRRLVAAPAAEAAVLHRRCGLALAGGLLTLTSIGAGTHTPLAWATVGLGAATLAGAGAVVVGAGRLRPVADGDAGDFAFDLARHESPWRLAFVIAGAVAFCVALDGVVVSDPLDGFLRAIVDGGLCLGGFAVLGRWLGLRR